MGGKHQSAQTRVFISKHIKECAIKNHMGNNSNKKPYAGHFPFKAEKERQERQPLSPMATPWSLRLRFSSLHLFPMSQTA